MKPHGDSHFAENFHNLAIYLPLVLLKPQNLEMLLHIEEAQDTGDSLGDHRRPGSPGRTHFKDNDRKQIKDYINHGGQQEEIDRCAAVPQRADNAGCHIVKVGHRNSRKYNKDVAVRLVNNVLRRLHPEKDPAAEHADRDSHCCRKKQGQPGRVCRKLSKPSIISCPESLGHRNGKSAAQKPIIIKLIEPVEPTAAKAFTPRYFPTIIVSTML